MTDLVGELSLAPCIVARKRAATLLDQLAHAPHGLAVAHHLAGEPQILAQHARRASRLAQLQRQLVELLDGAQRAHELGQQLSREIQARQMGELVAGRMATVPCPKCRIRCQLNFRKRTVTSIDGPVEVEELQGYCSACRRAFFPRQGDAGV